MSLWWQHTPKQSLSDPKPLCHDNSLAVMTTVAIECVLPIVDWGLERQTSQVYGHSAQVECSSVVDYCLLVLGVFGALYNNSIIVYSGLCT